MDMIKDKPKIAIVLDEMSVGGIPLACISFLQELCLYSEVTIFLCNEQGVFTNKIPTNAKIKICPFLGLSNVLKELTKKKKIFKTVGLAISTILYGKICKRWVKSTIKLSKATEKISNEKYDCVIAYHGMNIRQLARVLYQVEAEKKIAWIHGNHPFIGKHRKDAEKVYQKFDYIFCVSNATRQDFLRDFPVLQNKTGVYYNHFNLNDIVEKSNETTDFEYLKQEINVVTVGRISQEKGQELIPPTLAILLHKGLNVHWYLVGDGADKERIERLAKELKVHKVLTFLGNKANPYPYVKKCDLYVQPSYTEGYPLAILEAAILQKTIVATNVGGTKEHLRDFEDIIITEPNPASLAEKIELAILDKELQEKIKHNLKNRDFSNKGELKKLFNVISM